MRLGWFAGWCMGVTLLYGQPLYDLVVFAVGSSLYSHIILVPVVSLYLGCIRRRPLPPIASGSLKVAWLPLALGLMALSAYGLLVLSGPLDPTDSLALLTVSYGCVLVAGALVLLGPRRLRALLFPLAFLVFMIPLPTALIHNIEVFLQHASAQAAFLMLEAARTPMVHDGLAFRLPGITIIVGQECSGIHSSLVLLITSILAGHIFLVASWKKALLALVVIPLAVLRNAFRIFTLAMLCVHSDPAWIDSALHRRGGPIFFALSLIPFLALLLGLRWTESGRVKRGVPAARCP